MEHSCSKLEGQMQDEVIALMVGVVCVSSKRLSRHLGMYWRRGEVRGESR
jgi:hypothetical protein